MEFSISPTYTELFNEKCDDPQIFLKDYNSNEILGYLSLINAYLFNNDEDEPETQTLLLAKLLSFWRPEVQDQFKPFISAHVLKTKQKPNFFKTLYVTYFVHNELLNYKTGRETTLDSLGELNALKAYFAYLERYYNEHNLIEEKIIVSDNLDFCRITWPFLLKQFDFSGKVDPMYEGLCTGMMLEHFYNEVEFKNNIISYLRHYKTNSVWQFVFSLFEIIKISWGKNEEYGINHFLIKGIPEFSNLLDSRAIDAENYLQNTNAHLNFLGLRQKPLLKIRDNEYIVLNWKFLYKSIYIGTLFDFKDMFGYGYNFLKSIIGKKVVEERLFKELFTYAMVSEKAILCFSNDKKDGIPDCYLRIGKYILLIEFKDYLIPTKTISSGSFETIKNHIDENFILNKKGAKKGVNQILEQIKKLDGGGFDFDRFEEKGFKKKNIVICPIIVTTSNSYQMPGINKYLSDILENMQEQEQFSFNKIVPLTIVDFQFIYRQFNRIRKGQIDFKEQILAYQEKIKSYTKQYNSDKSMRNDFLRNSSFEECIPSNIATMPVPQQESDFSEHLFKAYRIVPEESTF